jgi:hypothetical protein
MIPFLYNDDVVLRAVVASLVILRAVVVSFGPKDLATATTRSFTIEGRDGDRSG